MAQMMYIAKKDKRMTEKEMSYYSNTDTTKTTPET
jgi:hypothetical protein